MSGDALKLTTYFGERDRVDGRFLADALADLYAERGIRTSVLLRGIEGFGVKHQLHTARLLTLSEDLPVVSVAVDSRDRIEAAQPAVMELCNHGLVTLERARMLGGSGGHDGAREQMGDQSKLTVYLGRRQRIDDLPAHVAAVRLLHDSGVAGATVLMGVDGTAHGARRRASLIGRNADVPLMLIAVGDTERLLAAADTLCRRVEGALMTLERVQILKRDGRRLSDLRAVPESTESGLAVWRKLMVYAGEQARHDGRPLYPQLVRELRMAGALGATALRGIWGYHGDHQPHGDRLFALRRRVPVLAITVDTLERSRRWFEIVDRLTDRTGLVTSELVPAARASGPDIQRGGLRLAPRVRWR